MREMRRRAGRESGETMENREELRRDSSAGRVLCGASSYAKKYYLNPEFMRLPEQIRRELQILCVTLTEEAGGILTLEYDAEGNLQFKVQADDGDYLFDDIASGMQISRARREHREMLEALELYYRTLYCGFSEADRGKC